MSASLDRTYSLHRRLTILRLLDVAPANCSILTDAANAHGVPSTRDQVRTDMRWLAEQGLIVIDELGPQLIAGKITQDGIEVRHGRRRSDGVKRPSPAELA